MDDSFFFFVVVVPLLSSTCPGYSEGCAACMAQLVGCSRDHCINQCISSDKGAACTGCVKKNCRPQMQLGKIEDSGKFTCDDRTQSCTRGRAGVPCPRSLPPCAKEGLQRLQRRRSLGHRAPPMPSKKTRSLRPIFFACLA